MTKKGSTLSFLKTSLPAALDLASQPVMWLVEAVFIGRLSAAALGGVGFALQIIMVTVTLLLTFVMGAIIVMNRHLGSNNRWEANHILGQTMMLGFLLSVPIGIIWYFGSPVLFQLIREGELLASLPDSASYISGMDSGIQYLQTVSLFCPVLITNFVAVGLIRGSGDTHMSMTINVTVNVTNALLTPVLIYGFFGLPRLEVMGAALAMGIAHTIGFGITIAFLRRKKGTLFLSFREMTTPNWSSVKRLFQMGLPTTVEQLVWSAGQLVVTGFVSMIGITELAIHQVLLRIQGVLSMFYLGFGMAAMTHMGKNLGANDRYGAEKHSQITHRIVFVFGVFILILMIVFAGPLLHIFIRKEDALIADYAYRIIFIAFALVQVPKAMNTVISGNLRGAGDMKWMMYITILGVLFFEIMINWAGAFIFRFGLLGIWVVQMLDETFKSNTNYYRFRGGKWKLIQI